MSPCVFFTWITINQRETLIVIVTRHVLIQSDSNTITPSPFRSRLAQFTDSNANFIRFCVCDADGGGWKNQPPTSANPPTAAVPLNRHSTPPPSSKHRSISPIRTPHSPAVTTMVAAEDPESFFATAPPLEDAGAVAARLQEFVARNYSSHASSGTYQLNRARPAAERVRGVISSSTRGATSVSLLTRANLFPQRARRGWRAAADRVRHVGRDDGAAGAAVRALHRQLQLRPPRRRVHRVSFLASFIIGCSSCFSAR